jgi:hypothetical protein
MFKLQCYFYKLIKIDLSKPNMTPHILSSNYTLHIESFVRNS